MMRPLKSINDGQIILDLELTEKIHNHFLY